MTRTFAANARPGIAPYNITGTEYVAACGIPMVAHKTGKQWDVTEPISGRSVTRHHKTSELAKAAADYSGAPRLPPGLIGE